MTSNAKYLMKSTSGEQRNIGLIPIFIKSIHQDETANSKGNHIWNTLEYSCTASEKTVAGNSLNTKNKSKQTMLRK